MSFLTSMFKTEKPVIGMLHLRPLPGDPLYYPGGSVSQVVEAAKRDLEARVWQNSSRLGSPSSCASHWRKATCPRCTNLRCAWGGLDRYTGSCRNRSRTECRI